MTRMPITRMWVEPTDFGFVVVAQAGKLRFTIPCELEKSDDEEAQERAAKHIGNYLAMKTGEDELVVQFVLDRDDLTQFEIEVERRGFEPMWELDRDKVWAAYTEWRKEQT